jgi:5-dehydro-6-demethoxy-6-hydroxyfumagillol O-methyltransferase
MHSIFHDWPDEKAVEILRNLRPAFKEGYSKLIVNECILPSTGANPIGTGLDLVMMGCFSSKERSKTDWENLFRDAGFHITGIWGDPAVAYESVIEVEPIGFS